MVINMLQKGVKMMEMRASNYGEYLTDFRKMSMQSASTLIKRAIKVYNSPLDKE